MKLLMCPTLQSCIQWIFKGFKGSCHVSKYVPYLDSALYIWYSLISREHQHDLFYAKSLKLSETHFSMSIQKCVTVCEREQFSCYWYSGYLTRLWWCSRLLRPNPFAGPLLLRCADAGLFCCPNASQKRHGELWNSLVFMCCLCWRETCVWCSLKKGTARDA